MVCSARRKFRRLLGSRPVERFVEQQDGRPGQQTFGQFDLAGQAARQRVDLVVQAFLEVGPVDGFAQSLGIVAAAQAVKGGVQTQIFADREMLVDRRALKHHGHLGARLGGLPQEIEAADGDGSGRGQGHPAEDPKQGRFSAAVRSGQDAELAGADAQGQIVDGSPGRRLPAARIDVGKVADLDHGVPDKGSGPGGEPEGEGEAASIPQTHRPVKAAVSRSHGHGTSGTGVPARGTNHTGRDARATGLFRLYLEPLTGRPSRHRSSHSRRARLSASAMVAARPTWRRATAAVAVTVASP